MRMVRHETADARPQPEAMYRINGMVGGRAGAHTAHRRTLWVPAQSYALLVAQALCVGFSNESNLERPILPGLRFTTGVSVFPSDPASLSQGKDHFQAKRGGSTSRFGGCLASPPAHTRCRTSCEQQRQCASPSHTRAQHVRGPRAAERPTRCTCSACNAQIGASRSIVDAWCPGVRPTVVGAPRALYL